MSQEIPNIHCSECGAVFRCGAQAGEKSCWCFALPHALPLPKTGEKAGCLCSKCLQAAIAKTMIDSKQAEED